MSNSSPDAKTLAARIAALEADLEAQRGKTAKAEASVADAYASGSNPETALGKLSNERSTLVGMIKALTTLDGMWYEAATAEYFASVKRINDATDASFSKIVAAFESAVKAHVVPILEGAGVPDTLTGEFTASTKSLSWEILSAKASDDIRKLGPAPRPRPERDEAGKAVPA